MLATIRPDSWNLPLLVHVLGAMVLVGATAMAVTAELVSVRSTNPTRLRRVAFRIFLLVSLPAYIVMHVGAEWIHSREFPNGASDPAWIGIGYITADAGGLLFIIALILAGVASRKSKARLGRASGLLAAVALAGWVVAVWAMGAKPT